jgi:hypothetical protein
MAEARLSFEERKTITILIQSFPFLKCVYIFWHPLYIERKTSLTSALAYAFAKDSKYNEEERLAGETMTSQIRSSPVQKINYEARRIFFCHVAFSG